MNPFESFNGKTNDKKLQELNWVRFCREAESGKGLNQALFYSNFVTFMTFIFTSAVSHRLSITHWWQHDSHSRGYGGSNHT